ncbi:unnamed protein product [Peronospora belbahrii]|uniref:CNNM transmembrane domain-containing protein n=1 Tax=Peronospora belbahrii TaxID=622444 RepID=A0AAU9LCV7_9STRA|nr:unnamed protein product [Peronospora belbahrii]
MLRSYPALLIFSISSLLSSSLASSMISLLIHTASISLVARRLTDVAPDTSNLNPSSDVSTAIHYVAIFFLLVMSAISSGLTLGLLSLDKVSLDVIVRAGNRLGATEEEVIKAKAAQRILPVRADSNLLLTTLVLTTVAVNSLLSILIADMTSALVSFFASTILILIFGEIVPQSLFGEDVGTVFTKRELQQLVDIHVRQKVMHPDEGHIVRGAMSYKNKVVSDIMIPVDKLFSLPISFFPHVLKLIYNQGYSRIPVWNKDLNDVVGIIFTKDLIYVDPNQEVPLMAFARVFAVAAHRIWLDAKLGEVLSVFKMGSTHMALVYDVNNTGPSDPFYELKGLVTLEDIVEEILQSKITNETNLRVARQERQSCTDQIGSCSGAYMFSDEDPLLSESKTSFGTSLELQNQVQKAQSRLLLTQ